MKKVLFTLAAIVAAVSVEARMFGFGVKAGLDMPKVTTDIAAATTDLSFGGFHAGVLAEVIIPVVGIGVQPELLYVNKRLKVFGERSHTMEIPINISWGVGLPVLDIRVFGIVAPTFTYAFNEMSKLSLNGESTGIAIPTFNKTAWGIALGAGLDIWKLQFMVKWKWGISDLVDVSDLGTAVGSAKKLKENTLTISLAYILFDI